MQSETKCINNSPTFTSQHIKYHNHSVPGSSVYSHVVSAGFSSENYSNQLIPFVPRADLLKLEFYENCSKRLMRILNFHTSALSLSIVLRTTKLQTPKNPCFYVLWALHYSTGFHNKTITTRDAFVSKNTKLKTQHNRGWKGLKEMSEFSTQWEQGGHKDQ